MVFFLARVAAEALAGVLDDMAAATTSLVFLSGSLGLLVSSGMPDVGLSGLLCSLAYAETARGVSIGLVSGNKKTKISKKMNRRDTNRLRSLPAEPPQELH